MPQKKHWEGDLAFEQVAQRMWPSDLAKAKQNLNYDKGATQRLNYRYQGWLAAKE